MKVKPQLLNKKAFIETLDTLYTALGSLKGRDAVKLFLKDLLTPSERIMLGRRILIAQKLLGGAGSRDIEKTLGVGQETVERVKQWLHDELPGYEQAIKGLEIELEKRRSQHELKRSFANLKRKYPLHFLLFPWPKGYKPKDW